MLHLSKLLINASVTAFGLFLILSPISAQKAPTGMVLVSGDEYYYKQVNRWREGLENHEYVEGPAGDAYIEEAVMQMPDYFIDKTEVTNAEYKKFLDASGYKPKYPYNFLKHWKKGTYPKGQGNHPVTYVDLDDAKAYAKWAGKMIPCERKWQYAAQGTDGRIFPWGDRWDKSKANVRSSGTKTVGSYPEGASPFGALDMAGNVSEMTDSYEEDLWHRFMILRGGSWFQSFGSIWYVQNGIVANHQRVKYWMINPGFNRSSTIGFRCIKVID